MIIKKYIDHKISGLYNIGKRYSLDLYAKDKESLSEIMKNLPKNVKTIEINEMDKNLGVRLVSYNISDLLKYQKSKGLEFKLEHL